MERHFFVKQKVSRVGTVRHKNVGLGMFFQHRAMNFNIGIGTTSPLEKLDVSGNIKLTGRIRQGSMGDVAEMMAVSPYVIAHTSSLRGSEMTEAISGIASSIGFAGSPRNDVRGEIASDVGFERAPRNDMKKGIVSAVSQSCNDNTVNQDPALNEKWKVLGEQERKR